MGLSGYHAMNRRVAMHHAFHTHEAIILLHFLQETTMLSGIQREP
jgi:hypothetical protein